MLLWSFASFVLESLLSSTESRPGSIRGYGTIGDLSSAIRISRTYRYASKVFLAPPWEAIYTTDNERKQDFAEAVRTAELMANVYRERGYNVIELPLVSPNDRADFILQQVGIAGCRA